MIDSCILCGDMPTTNHGYLVVCEGESYCGHLYDLTDEIQVVFTPPGHAKEVRWSIRY